MGFQNLGPRRHPAEMGEGRLAGVDTSEGRWGARSQWAERSWRQPLNPRALSWAMLTGTGHKNAILLCCLAVFPYSPLDLTVSRQRKRWCPDAW